MAMPEVSETDFAIVVFREDDGWDADVLPVAVTDDLKGFIRVLRQQPSIAGTIGLAGIDDYFFVAVRVVGNQVSVLLSDIGAALDYPLAEQVLDYLDIPVPDEEDLDQVLPVGDLSIFADLGPGRDGARRHLQPAGLRLRGRPLGSRRGRGGIHRGPARVRARPWSARSTSPSAPDAAA